MTNYLGQFFGYHMLTKLLDYGGSADVYLGRHSYLRTYAAIKVLRTHLVTYQQQSAFFQEARMMAPLDHSNIVRVLDAGIKFGTPYIVMDYAMNGTLRKRYHYGQRVPLDTLLTYISPLADALDYIHQLGMVHRDVKPENILLGRNDHVMLGDFGIALNLQYTKLQENSDIAGTTSYIAPEHLQGKAVPASDQYALGIVVYELLSGRRPFKGTKEEIMWQQAYASPPRLSQKFPDIAPEVERVIFKALRKNPKHRFASVQEFVFALQEARDASLLPSRGKSTVFLHWLFK